MNMIKLSMIIIMSFAISGCAGSGSDISKAKKDLGYNPVCELKEGMRQSIEWCLENGHEI